MDSTVFDGYRVSELRDLLESITSESTRRIIIRTIDKKENK